MILGMQSTGTPVTWTISDQRTGNIDRYLGWTIDEPVKTSPVRQEVEVIVLAKNLQGESYLRRQPVSTYFLTRRNPNPEANPEIDSFKSVQELVDAQIEAAAKFAQNRASRAQSLEATAAQGLALLAAE